jgi:uncharacterized protein (DUF924 family)
VLTLRKLTIELEEDLAEKLWTEAKAHNWTPEDLARECVAQHLEIAVRHRAVVERFEAIDHHLAALARFVGQASASTESVDLWKICRYRGEKSKT